LNRIDINKIYVHFVDFQHHLERNPPRIRRRVMRAFTKWSEGTITDQQLKNIILPLLRHSPSLVEEFAEFFDDCPASQW